MNPKSYKHQNANIVYKTQKIVSRDENQVVQRILAKDDSFRSTFFFINLMIDITRIVSNCHVNLFQYYFTLNNGKN